MNDHSVGDQAPWPETWSELIGAATAFRRSCLLFAAIELDVFSAIAADEVDAETVASRIGLDSRSTATLLKSLVAVGLLSWRDNCVALLPRHLEFLLPGRNSALPDIRRYIAENVAWLDAASILRGTLEPSPAYARELLDGRIMDFPALGRFNALHAAAVIDTLQDVLPPPRNVLDLGGGDGVFARQILNRYPDTKVTVLELEGGARGCQTDLSDSIALGRLVVRYGDARSFRPEAVYDLVVINELLELYSHADKARIVNHAMAAVAPAGKILLVKFTLDESGIEPAASAVFSMRMRIKSGSHLETDADVVALLCSAGCAPPLVRKAGRLKTVFLAGR